MKLSHVFLRQGWTLAELLIAVALIAILVSLFFLGNIKANINRSYDARRKEDLVRIRSAFEENFNDKSCYPASTILDTCDGSELAPYLAKIPCDPQTQTPYLYVPDSGNICNGYVICALLKDLTDPEITAIGCHPVNGCGYGSNYNYCLAAGVPVTPPGFNPNVPPTPTPTPAPILEGNYACAPGGFCNRYADPAGSGCSRSWADEQICKDTCPGNPQYWCKQ